MSGTSPRPEAFNPRLGLDFANTWRGDTGPDYDDLVSWAAGAGVLDEDGANLLAREAKAKPAEATEVLTAAADLAFSIRNIFRAVAGGDDPNDASVDGLNRSLASALPRLSLRRSKRCCTWTWSGPDNALDRMLWPVARSAADLLTSSTVDRVRECASESCTWLFIDGSRNRQRKWCDMATCGNRAKAKRYYNKHRNTN